MVRNLLTDQRKFGWMKLMPTDEIENLPFMQKASGTALDKKLRRVTLRKRIVVGKIDDKVGVS